MVGIELGIQPLLFRRRTASPLYSPYGLGAAIPAMLLAHVFGASIVEGADHGVRRRLSQQRHPEYLTSAARSVAGERRAVGQAARARCGSSWRRASACSGRRCWPSAGSGRLAAAIRRTLFGADWSPGRLGRRSRSMLLVVGVIAAILVPLAWFVLPRRMQAGRHGVRGGRACWRRSA